MPQDQKAADAWRDNWQAVGDAKAKLDEAFQAVIAAELAWQICGVRSASTCSCEDNRHANAYAAAREAKESARADVDGAIDVFKSGTDTPVAKTAVTRFVEKFASQPAVTYYRAKAPEPLRGVALQCELVDAGFPADTNVSSRGDEVDISIVDDDKHDRTAVVAKVLKAHKGTEHPNEPTDSKDIMKAL